MELLNHLVAAKLMKTAEGFERIGTHGAAAGLPSPSDAFVDLRPLVSLVVDNSAASDPAPAPACSGNENCAELEAG